jgi:ABC-type multidrug transport system fused ATPase/permease subunit
VLRAWSAKLSLLSTYLRPEWPRAVLLGLLLFTGIGLQLANPQIAKTFIDEAQAGEPLERLVWIALLFVCIAVLTQAATVAEAWVAEDLGWRTTNALRADLTRHVLDLDVSFHAEHSSGELIERIDGDASAIADFFARFVMQVLGNGIFLLGVLILLYREDWRVGALLSLTVLIAVMFMTRGGGFVTTRSKAARQAAAEFSAYVAERLDGLPDIKSSGADAYAMRRLHERLATRFLSNRASVFAGSVFNSAVGVLFVAGTGAALAMSAALLGAGAITVGSVYVVFRYTGMLRQPLERLTRQMNSFLQAAGAIVRIRELLETRPRISAGASSTLPAGALSVEFDRVSFAYEAEPVLRGVSLRLEPGDVLGLLGRTGSGKTTISRLLFRLYDPIEGTIRLGGTDVRQASLNALRQSVGLVTQDVQLFQGTLRDNVTMFDSSVSDARLRDVFGQLGLAEWLHELPSGLETQLGAGGRGVSAGEAQLVALARVFLKSPGLVVLDEASSRLDPHTEELLEHAVSRLLDDRTGIVIAHRLATVERADWIAILEDGCLVELGRRSELAFTPESRFSQLLRAGMSEVLV